MIRRVLLSKLPSPYEAWPWDGGVQEKPLRRAEVSKVLKEGRLCEAPHHVWGDTSILDAGNLRLLHVARVAYLVKNPDLLPLEIEVYPSAHGDFTLNDGYHRVAAALFRKETEIRAEISGYVASEEAKDLLVPRKRRT